MTSPGLVDVPRRTQDERRTATRQALLDASLNSLLEDGYAGLTTRRVAARAGVSPATQRFHFRSRSSFVAAAVEQLAIELGRQIGDLALASENPVDRFRACLDELWKICNGPTFLIMSELAAAARSGDTDARQGFAVADHAVTRQIAIVASELFPDDIAYPRFRVLIDLATSAMRGLAMFSPIVEPVELDQRWRAIRNELSDGYESLRVDRRRSAGAAR